MRRMMRTAAGMLIGTLAYAGTPEQVNYQGRLLDALGNPVSSNVTVDVAVYTGAGGGDLVFSEAVGTVPVQDGVYSFAFGAAGAGLAAVLTNSECWLEVAINGLPLSPRQKLLSVPYALRALDVQDERDPVWGAVSGAVLTNLTKLELWGNHATNGYLIEERDPAWLLASNAVYMGATAFGWGDHATNGYLTSYTELDPLWTAASNAVLEQLTEVQGWGDHVTNGYLSAESDPAWAAVSNALSEMTALGATAFGWGDHGTNGYLTSFTELDPLWTAASNAVLEQLTEAQGWGDHATNGYLSAESDPAWAAVSNALSEMAALGAAAHAWGDHGTNGYLTSFTELDPLWAAASNAVLEQLAEVQGWGDHATNGYLSAESDPAWAAVSNALSEMAALGATAFGWGDHGTNGYLTSFTELDPLWTAASNAVLEQLTEAQGWGDHATNGYLSAESDPAWAAVSNALSEMAALGATAHGWGDHGTNGYLTALAEVDPVFATSGVLRTPWAATNTLFAQQITGLSAATLALSNAVTVVVTGKLDAAVAATQAWAMAQYPQAVLRDGSRSITGVVQFTAGLTVGNNGLAVTTNGLVVGISNLVVTTNGFVGIGIANPTNRLAVNGTIQAREIVVTISGWPDYVFGPDWVRMPLDEVAAHVRTAGHLPGVPTAEDVARDGVSVGAMQKILLEKIEELTLHAIELQEQNRALQRRVEALEQAAPRD